jgi:hypothetical protein
MKEESIESLNICAKMKVKKRSKLEYWLKVSWFACIATRGVWEGDIDCLLDWKKGRVRRRHVGGVSLQLDWSP